MTDDEYKIDIPILIFSSMNHRNRSCSGASFLSFQISHIQQCKAKG